jgi:two-component system chemotaxis response regulator CheY
MKVLVVDDSTTLRRILAGTLRQLGMKDILEAPDGVAAVAIFDANKDIGLVLLDWNMPNMNGFEVLKTIRGRGSQAAVVMVTTEAEKERILEAIKAGANDYVIKPFTQEIVIGKIQKVLARVQAAGTT